MRSDVEILPIRSQGVGEGVSSIPLPSLVSSSVVKSKRLLQYGEPADPATICMSDVDDEKRLHVQSVDGAASQPITIGALQIRIESDTVLDGEDASLCALCTKQDARYNEEY